VSFKVPDITTVFNADRGLVMLGVAFVLAVYAKLTGDVQPFAVFVMIMSLIFIFDVVNIVMGKLNQ
jgi:hypothetical protein